MQILPLPGREQAIKAGLADPAKAIKWAMENCFMPGYQSHEQKWGLDSPLEGKISGGLIYYNGGPQGDKKRITHIYVQDIIARGAALMEADGLWSIVPG